MQEPYEILEQVEAGNLKPGLAYVTLRSFKSEIEYAIKKIEDQVVTQLSYLHDNEPLVISGFKLSHVEGRKIPQYKESALWKHTNDEKKRVEELIKLANKLSESVVDSRTGEVIDPVEVKLGNGYIKMERTNEDLQKII
jgi:hypothetical protein